VGTAVDRVMGDFLSQAFIRACVGIAVVATIHYTMILDRCLEWDRCSREWFATTPEGPWMGLVLRPLTTRCLHCCQHCCLFST